MVVAERGAKAKEVGEMTLLLRMLQKACGIGLGGFRGREDPAFIHAQTQPVLDFADMDGKPMTVDDLCEGANRRYTTQRVAQRGPGVRPRADAARAGLGGHGRQAHEPCIHSVTAAPLPTLVYPSSRGVNAGTTAASSTRRCGCRSAWCTSCGPTWAAVTRWWRRR
jgi:hypothetical protein